MEKIVEENNKFLITNMESIMKDHKEPSPITLEKLANLQSQVIDMQKDNEKSDFQILKRLDEMKGAQDKWMQGMEATHVKLEGKVRSIEDWKLVFTTKMTVYSTIAIILGTAIGQFILSIFKNYIF